MSNNNLSAMVKSPAVMARVNEVLGKRANQFVASVLTLTSASQQLAKCDPKTVLAAAITAATLDLPINQNLGFAHIVPYKDQAQFQMGYKGFIQLAMRTGQYASMNALPVNSEAFIGFDDIGEPLFDFSKLDDTKDPDGYFFGFKMVNGFSKKEYWTKEKMKAHALRYSQSFKKGYSCPWKDNFDGMALKTIVKNVLSKWGILSVEMQNAIESDQAVIKDDGFEYADNKKESSLEQSKLFEIEEARQISNVANTLESMLNDAPVSVEEVKAYMEENGGFDEDVAKQNLQSIVSQTLNWKDANNAG